MSRPSSLAPPLAVLLASLLAAAAVVTACSAPRERLAPAPAASSAKATDGGTWRVTWEPESPPVPLNELFSSISTVSLDTSSEGGEIVVAVDAGMPGHGHGMNTRPRTLRQPDGRHRTEGLLFHMPGVWQVTVTVTRGNRTERALFDVEIP